MVSLFFISTFKNILEKIKPAFRERNLLLGVKKSKEVVKNWNQRFLDIKVLISIVNFGKGSN
ncbi:hypothetical protein DWX92_05455 [Holdemanella biformis]|uniref:Uncharacterized protein n=1 Tax=Holdemanella biformis TaxID=1735 RepID=A0A412J3E3_9FIRM|nr:hypothetical protein DWX92_05455 [Holdemanella biformis]